MSCAQIQGVSLNPYEVLSIVSLSPLQYGQQLLQTDNRTGRIRATDSAMEATIGAEWVWRPSLTMGGYSGRVCFRLQGVGPGSTGAGDEACIIVSVLRCKYRVQPGDSFESVAQVGLSPDVRLYHSMGPKYSKQSAELQMNEKTD